MRLKSNRRIFQSLEAYSEVSENYNCNNNTQKQQQEWDYAHMQNKIVDKNKFLMERRRRRSHKRAERRAQRFQKSTTNSTKNWTMFFNLQEKNTDPDYISVNNKKDTLEVCFNFAFMKTNPNWESDKTYCELFQQYADFFFFIFFFNNVKKKKK